MSVNSPLQKHDDNSTSFLMRLQEAILNEAEMTRDTLAEGEFMSIGRHVRSFKITGHSSLSSKNEGDAIIITKKTPHDSYR